MPSESIDDYEIEYDGQPLPQGEGWGAYVTIYGPSKNPMHRNAIVPTQHVLVETVFADQPAAQAAAREQALALVAKHRVPGSNG